MLQESVLHHLISTIHFQSTRRLPAVAFFKASARQTDSGDPALLSNPTSTDLYGSSGSADDDDEEVEVECWEGCQHHLDPRGVFRPRSPNVLVTAALIVSRPPRATGCVLARASVHTVAEARPRSEFSREISGVGGGWCGHSPVNFRLRPRLRMRMINTAECYPTVSTVGGRAGGVPGAHC